MKTKGNALRCFFRLSSLLAICTVLAACGGGGSGTSSSPSGTASVSVSLASAPGFPADTTFAAPLATADPAAKPETTVFDNVLVTVTKLALIPSSGPGSPNRNGEPEQQNAPAEEGLDGMPGFVTATLDSPITIDLYHTPPSFETSLPLTTFDNVPAGEYSKIRVYYDSVVGRSSNPLMDNVVFHHTANYHFDVHFVGGNLVVPEEASEPGFRLHSVVINVVGLKITQAGKSGNFLMRPQVFAMVESPAGLKFIVHGEAEEVNTSEGTFLIRTAPDRTVPVVYAPDTIWRYVDPFFPVSAWESAGSALGDAGLRDTAIVDVIGPFSPDTVLLAEEIDVELPAVRAGDVLGGWTPDNTAFILRPPSDNTVYPMPDRESAYYDNAVTFLPLNFEAIMDNAAVTARGYAVQNDNAIEAFWISIGE